MNCVQGFICRDFTLYKSLHCVVFEGISPLLRDPVSTLCMLIVDENPLLSDHQAAPPLGRLRSGAWAGQQLIIGNIVLFVLKPRPSHITETDTGIQNIQHSSSRQKLGTTQQSY